MYLFYYLQDCLIVDVVEDSPVDLTWLQGNPVQHRHPKLGLDWLLDLHGCAAWRQVHSTSDLL